MSKRIWFSKVLGQVAGAQGIERGCGGIVHVNHNAMHLDEPPRVLPGKAKQTVRGGGKPDVLQSTWRQRGAKKWAYSACGGPEMGHIAGRPTSWMSRMASIAINTRLASLRNLANSKAASTSPLTLQGRQ